MMTRRQFFISTAAFSTVPITGVGLKADEFTGVSRKKTRANVLKRECSLFGGRKLSLLGFGSASGWCVNNRDEAIKCLRYAIDSGINYFDTAYNYHGGKGEVLLSEGLRVLPRELDNFQYGNEKLSTTFLPWGRPHGEPHEKPKIRYNSSWRVVR